MWSAYGGPWIAAQATLPGVNVLSSLPGGVARDVVSLRAAGTYRLDVGARSDVVLRAGGGFEPSMLSTFQQGETNLVDGDKLLAGLGASLALRGLLPATLRFGAGASVQGVLRYAQDKQVCAAAPCARSTRSRAPTRRALRRGSPTPGTRGSRRQGAFWSMSLGIGVEL